MSENRIAASTPCRRTGCRVISVTRSGSWQACEHRRPGPQRPVLRQRPAGLAHEPDRGAADRQTARGADQVGVGRRGGRDADGAGGGGHDRRSSQTAAPAGPPSADGLPRDPLRRVGRGVLVGGLPCGRGAAQPGRAPGTRGRDAGGDEPPAAFRAALDALARVRRPPRDRARAHPGAAAPGPLGARRRRARVAEPDGDDDELEIASARFIVLFDPDGHEAWNGTIRCVGYLSAGHRRGAGRRRHVLRGRVELADRRPRPRPGPGTTTSAARSPARPRPASATWPAPSTPSTSRCAPPGRRRTPTSTVTCRPGSTSLGNAAGLPPPGVRLLGPSDRTPSETL